VLVDKRLKGRLEDVYVLRSWGYVIWSEHFLVVARMCWGETRYEKRVEKKVQVIRVSELLKNEKTEKCRKLIFSIYKKYSTRIIRGIESK
jgi:hypothetical protein